MKRCVLFGLVLILSTGTLHAGVLQAPAGSVIKRAEAGLTEAEKVDRLIQFVRSMKDATFIRNGSEHTCQEAADHLRSKWEKHRDKIGSAREFIQELASKSGFSGEPYKIRFRDGTEVTTGTVLSQELARLEKL